MKFNKKKSSKVMEGDLTPMIDMTFQLIAFFMLLINFAEVEQAEEISLPSSVLAIPPAAPPDYHMVVNLNAEGTLIFEGQRFNRIENPNDPTADRYALGPIFTQEINSAARQGVRDPGKIAVIIRSSGGTPTGYVQDVIAQCQVAKLESFTLRVKETVN